MICTASAKKGTHWKIKVDNWINIKYYLIEIKMDCFLSDQSTILINSFLFRITSSYQGSKILTSGSLSSLVTGLLAIRLTQDWMASVIWGTTIKTVQVNENIGNSKLCIKRRK